MAAKLPHFAGLKYEASEGHVFSHEPLDGNAPWGDGMAAGPVPGFPYILNFARTAYYGGSGLTSKSNVLARLTPAQKLIINPADARKENVENGSKVMLKTAAASGELPVLISDEINQGELVLFGYSELNPPNKFMCGYNRPVYAKLSKT